jgi:hypothetical protein
MYWAPSKKIKNRTTGRPTLSASMQMFGSAAAENKTNRTPLPKCNNVMSLASL